MCIFSGEAGYRPLRHVSNTNIFARGAGQDQLLVYQMQYRASSDLAMILPIPVPPNGGSMGEKAVSFVDLTLYPHFFPDLERGFPNDEDDSKSARLGRALVGAGAPLEVHRVGSFEASFVPSQADFDRLDQRFQVPKEIWDQIPSYKEWGFVVAKLAPDGTHIHPLAFWFPRLYYRQLFFPTVHVHDGTLPKDARFDHALYCQSDMRDALQWRMSKRHSTYGDVAFARDFMNVGKVEGLIDPDAPVRRQRLRGMLPNRDQFLSN